MVEIPNRGFISRLSPATAAELMEGAPTVYYPAGSIIFSPRDGTTAGLVVSGLLRYYLAGVLQDVCRWPFPIKDDCRDPYSVVSYMKRNQGFSKRRDKSPWRCSVGA